ncbi:MAG: hypothetical protein KKA67_12510 [Spirochaetes bacterium]|nr:hypothetical protein [Spirochaetota bacterium]MBU1079548.1 hypothetical protein [Spirochaetota bacterium]
MARSALATACALVAAAAASCWQPYFDPGASASQLSASRMTRISLLAVPETQRYQAERGMFLPRRSAAPTDGVWLQGADLAGREYATTNAYYLGQASSGSLFYSPGTSFKGDPYGEPIVRMKPAAVDSEPLEAMGMALDGSDWAAGRLYRPDTVSASILIGDTLALPTPSRLLGAGFAAAAPGSDSLFAAYFDESLAAWRAIDGDYAGWPLGALAPVPLTMPPGFNDSAVQGVGYAGRVGSDYYLCATTADGASRTFRWEGELSAAPAELASIKAPLVAVLSDGTLLARDGSAYQAYGPDGAILFAFPAGSLRFAHERYDAASSAYRSVFARQSFISNSYDDKGTLRIELFEIPTEELPGLAR